MKSPITSHLSAAAFIAMLLACLIASVWQPFSVQHKLADGADAPMGWLDGKLSASAEKAFAGSLPYKDMVTGIWGAVRYGAFNTGAKGVIIGRDGWLFTEEEFDLDANYPQHVQHNLDRIQQVQRHLARRGIDLLVMFVPAKSDLYPQFAGAHQRPAAWKFVQQQMREALAANIHTIFLHDPFAVHQGKALFMRTDTHWSPVGARLAAQTVADYVAMHDIDLSAFKSTYTMEQGAAETYDGDLIDFVPTGGFRSLLGPKGEYLHSYTLTSDAQPASLFDAPPIGVVLVGTSYSAQPQWHADGYLKQALGTDVLNLADEGGGPIEPMMKFLGDLDTYSDTRLVIWEFPERFLPVDYREFPMPK